MVGAVIVAHSFIARELIATAEYIVGKMKGIAAVSLHCKMDAFKARKMIYQAIKKVDQGEGVILLTDLFGGSPSNTAFSFLEKGKIEVVTGVNLSMILTFWNNREGHSLTELSKYVQMSGRRNIVIAKNLMGPKSIFRRILAGDTQLSN